MSVLEQLDELIEELGPDAWSQRRHRTLLELRQLREAIAPDTPR